MPWRHVLATALSMAVLLVWLVWVSSSPPQKPPAEPPARPEAAPVPAAGAGPGAPGQPGLARPQAEPAPAGPVSMRPRREHKEITAVVPGRYQLLCDSRGACLAKVYLTELKESVDGDDPYLLLLPPQAGAGTLGLEIEDPKNAALPSLLPPDEDWQIDPPPPDPGAPLVSFKNELDGVLIEKIVLVGGPELAGGDGEAAAPRHLKVRLQFKNQNADPRALTYRFYGPAAIDSENSQTPGYDLEIACGAWGRGDAVHVEVIAASKIIRRDFTDRKAAWIGVLNNYFASILFPLVAGGPGKAEFIEKAFAESHPDRNSLDTQAREKYGRPFAELTSQEANAIRDKAYKNLRAGFRSHKVTLEPGASVTHEYGLYIGPRDRSALDRFAPLNFVGANQYGMFGFLVKFFIWLLGLLKVAALGSWGMAIILLTLIVKICLHPINKRTQAGMQRFQKKLQRIKPEMDQLKERHGTNRVKMNQEMQKLWKREGINPGQQMAGCLIIFLQLPIWYGLYSTLQYALGLRQAGFLYIKDLTLPDMLFNFGVQIPWLGEWFNLLPVLYVILTVINQQLQPKPEDPQMRAQFRMMTFMLVFFGFIFYKMPAGFMLYIMTSAALGIIESKVIKAEIAREEKGMGTSPAGATPARGPSMYPGRSKKPEGGEGRERVRRT